MANHSIRKVLYGPYTTETVALWLWNVVGDDERAVDFECQVGDLIDGQNGATSPESFWVATPEGTVDLTIVQTGGDWVVFSTTPIV